MWNKEIKDWQTTTSFHGDCVPVRIVPSGPTIQLFVSSVNPVKLFTHRSHCYTFEQF